MTKNEAIDKMTAAIRRKGYSYATEKTYLGWLRRYMGFLSTKRYSSGVASRRKVEDFLTAQALRGCSPTTQNQALAAVLFFYQHVEEAPLEGVDALRAKQGDRVRQAPTVDETRRLLMAVQDSGQYPARLICHLIYGVGTRLGETLSIRLKDLDLASRRLTIIGGKGNKDRFVNLPECLIPQLELQRQSALAVQAKARAQGVPTKLPHLYARKHPAAAFQPGWFWLFPQALPCQDPRGGGRVWWHCLETTIQRAMRQASRRAGLDRNLSPHHLRHAWATHAHQSGAHARDLQEVLGHKDIRTTMRYLRPHPERVPSPLESLLSVA